MSNHENLSKRVSWDQSEEPLRQESRSFDLWSVANNKPKPH